MPELESIVRPFQLPIAPRRIVATNNKITVGSASDTFGAAGPMPSPQEFLQTPPRAQTLQVIDCDHQMAEKNRKTDRVKVASSKDPTNYIEVERINAISFYELLKNANDGSSQDTLTFTSVYTVPLDIKGFADFAAGSTTILNLTNVTGLVSGQKYVIMNASIFAFDGWRFFTFSGGTTGAIDALIVGRAGTGPADSNGTHVPVRIVSLGIAGQIVAMPVDVQIDQSKICNTTYNLNNPNT